MQKNHRTTRGDKNRSKRTFPLCTSHQQPDPGCSTRQRRQRLDPILTIQSVPIEVKALQRFELAELRRDCTGESASAERQHSKSAEPAELQRNRPCHVERVKYGEEGYGSDTQQKTTGTLRATAIQPTDTPRKMKRKRPGLTQPKTWRPHLPGCFARGAALPGLSVVPAPGVSCLNARGDGRKTFMCEAGTNLFPKMPKNNHSPLTSPWGCLFSPTARVQSAQK